MKIFLNSKQLWRVKPVLKKKKIFMLPCSVSHLCLRGAKNVKNHTIFVIGTCQYLPTYQVSTQILQEWLDFKKCNLMPCHDDVIDLKQCTYDSCLTFNVLKFWSDITQKFTKHILKKCIFISFQPAARGRSSVFFLTAYPR